MSVVVGLVLVAAACLAAGYLAGAADRLHRHTGQQDDAPPAPGQQVDDDWNPWLDGETPLDRPRW